MDKPIESDRYLFIDADNNICHQVYSWDLVDRQTLQAAFEKFVEKVRNQGKLALCVGRVYLLKVEDCGVRLHLDNDQPSGWQVFIPGSLPLTPPDTTK